MKPFASNLLELRDLLGIEHNAGPPKISKYLKSVYQLKDWRVLRQTYPHAFEHKELLC